MMSLKIHVNQGEILMNKIKDNLLLTASLLLIAMAMYFKAEQLKSEGHWGTIKSFSVGN